MKALTLQIAQFLQLPAHFTYLIDWTLRIVLALIILLITAVLARRARIKRIIDWLDNKIGVIELTEADRNFFSSLIKLVFWLIGLIIVLRVLMLTALLATLGVSAGLITTVTALANRELLGNVFAGFVLQARGQFRPGDAIKVLNISGTLEAIGLTACEVVSYDGIVHYIPNAKMLNEVLINYSHAKFRRVEITFWFDPDESYADEVIEVIDRVLENLEGQVEDKKGFYRFGEYTEKGQEMKLYIYLKTDNWTTQASEARRLLLEYIDESNVQIGIPQQLVIHVEDEEEEAPKKRKSSKK